MAAAGARTLVVEAESSFRDRVRGEAIMPWGVAEARLLGLDRILEQAAANPLTHWDSYQGPDRSGHRDLTRTTRAHEPVMACYHPALQSALLEHAEGAGTEVMRSTRVTGVSVSDGGASTCVMLERNGLPVQLSCRLVVGADGRGSPTRGWAGFPVSRDPERNLVAGVLLDNVALSSDATHAWLDTEKGHFILNFPQGNSRARVYLCYAEGSAPRYGGPEDISTVLGQCIASGVPAEVYADAVPAGPLATFEGRTTWTASAYRNGVALVGRRRGQHRSHLGPGSLHGPARRPCTVRVAATGGRLGRGGPGLRRGAPRIFQRGPFHGELADATADGYGSAGR